MEGYAVDNEDFHLQRLVISLLRNLRALTNATHLGVIFKIRIKLIDQSDLFMMSVNPEGVNAAQ